MLFSAAECAALGTVKTLVSPEDVKPIDQFILSSKVRCFGYDQYNCVAAMKEVL